MVTLIGKGTFHSMGLTSIHYPGFICSNSVPRFKERKKTSSIIQNKDIKFIGSSRNGLSKLKSDPISNLQYPTVIPSEMYCDLICILDGSSSHLATLDQTGMVVEM